MAADRRADSREPLTLDGSGALELRARYDATADAEGMRLFEPPPAPMAGQDELFDPDQPTTAGDGRERG